MSAAQLLHPSLLTALLSSQGSVASTTPLPQPH